MKHTYASGLVAATFLLASLAGCSQSSNTPASGEPAAGAASDNGAAPFVACLKSKGMKAKVSEKGGFVMIPADSTGAQMVQNDGSTQTRTEADPNSVPPLLLEMDEQGAWAAVMDAASLKDDPAAQEAYTACEAEVPNFKQPQSNMEDDPQLQAIIKEQTEHGLKFASCARDAGFSWVADPNPDDMGSILIPNDVTESDFRGALEACYTEGEPLSWGGGESAGDVMSILEDFDPIYRSN